MVCRVLLTPLREPEDHQHAELYMQSVASWMFKASKALRRAFPKRP